MSKTELVIALLIINWVRENKTNTIKYQLFQQMNLPHPYPTTCSGAQATDLEQRLSIRGDFIPSLETVDNFGVHTGGCCWCLKGRAQGC